MTNRELLKTPREHLSPLDRQHQQVLRTELAPVPCPACRTPLSALGGAGIGMDDESNDKPLRNYRCPHCQARLDLVVPFFAVGPGWSWELNHEWLTDRLGRADSFDRKHSEKQIAEDGGTEEDARL